MKRGGKEAGRHKARKLEAERRKSEGDGEAERRARRKVGRSGTEGKRREGRQGEVEGSGGTGRIELKGMNEMKRRAVGNR